MVKGNRLKQIGEVEGAPDWYGTPLRDLHFEWSPEEKLEIERYCEKILNNVAEEEMTPLERLKATFEGKPKDRVFLHVFHSNVFGARVLDSSADAIKPVDMCRNPKLWVKMNLANVARYKLDYANTYVINYGEEMWRCNAQLTEYSSNPLIVEEPKIKSIEDLEGLEVPDAEQDGLYPGYLWANRELRRIFDEYGLSKVMPMIGRICGDPHYIVMMYIMGWGNFMTNLRKNPEFCRRCLDLTTEFEVGYGQAMLNAARPDVLYMCSIMGAISVKGNEWLADYWAKVGKAFGSQLPIVYAYAFAQSVQWLPVLWERGALGPGSCSGGVHDIQGDPKTMIDFHREHDLYITSTMNDKTLLNGPVSVIEEEIKQLFERGKSYPRFAITTGVPDYWTPPAHLDAAIAASKKYGKY